MRKLSLVLMILGTSVVMICLLIACTLAIIQSTSIRFPDWLNKTTCYSLIVGIIGFILFVFCHKKSIITDIKNIYNA